MPDWKATRPPDTFSKPRVGAKVALEPEALGEQPDRESARTMTIMRLPDRTQASRGMGQQFGCQPRHEPASRRRSD
jgi:hypothetical protein